MKKIFVSLTLIVAASIAVIGATRSLFSDTEQVLGNSFAAGTLDLKVNDKDSDTLTAIYTLTNWKPGDDKMVGQFKVKNAGTVTGKYWVEITDIVNTEDNCTEPEIDAGDDCAEVNGGDLGALIRGYFQENVSPWTRLNPSFSSLNSAAGVPMVPADGGVLNPGEEVPIVLYAKWIPSASDNLAQGDTVTFSLVVHLEQL